MSHDPLCPSKGAEYQVGACPTCALISRVRADMQAARTGYDPRATEERP